MVGAGEVDLQTVAAKSSPPEAEPATFERQPHMSKSAQPVQSGRNAGSRKGRRVVLLFAAVAVVAAVGILFAKWLVSLDAVSEFLRVHPGEYEPPNSAPIGIPAWLSWQHFFNVFFMALIVRTGLQIRSEQRPPAYWTPKGPKGAPKISLTVWLHQALDVLWLANGALFVVLLFTTGQWMKIVPTSWEVFPNALSALIQYLSLDWPTENGWVNYNGLQQLTYFTTVFIAAPLAVVSGVRMSHVWPRNLKKLSAIYKIEFARAIHVPVMLYFCAFTVVHVALVLATGALRNLNHMYAGQDATNWWGFFIFLASLLVIAGGLYAARPLIVSSIASLFGKVGR